jgi:TATA-box binding protein (TBP) (component of TFIID and TFIIIB)
VTASQNMVCTANLVIALNLLTVVVALGLNRTEYIPEQYFALV